MELAPKETNFRDTLAEVYIQMGDTEKAVDALQGAIIESVIQGNQQRTAYLKGRLQAIEKIEQ